jgi:hypothetical protein
MRLFFVSLPAGHGRPCGCPFLLCFVVLSSSASELHLPTDIQSVLFGVNKAPLYLVHAPLLLKQNLKRSRGQLYFTLQMNTIRDLRVFRGKVGW